MALAAILFNPVARSEDLTLVWSDNSDNEIGFKIERSADGSSFLEIATVDAETESYTDTGLSAETPYWYRVRAYNSAGESGFSNTAGATTGSGSGSAVEVRLISPDDGAVYEFGESVTVSAEVSDASETARVELLIDGSVIGQDGNEPYIFLWSGAEPGSHTLQVQAIGLGGERTLSDVITVHFEDASSPDDPPSPGVYRGSFSAAAVGTDEGAVPSTAAQDTGRFSIWIDTAGSLRFLGFEGSTGAAFSVSDVTIASDGSFVVTGSADEGSVIVRGRIGPKGIDGTVDGTDLVLSGSWVDASGPSGPAVGVYEAHGIHTQDTSVTVIVGGDGLGVMTVVRGGVVRGDQIEVLMAEGGAYLSSDALATELSLNFESGSVRGIMTLEGGREIWLMGIRDDVVALRRLENISTRGAIPSGNGVLISGFVVSGSEPKEVLIRAVGPGLASFGVPDVVEDPVLDLISDSGTIATNSRWAWGDAGGAIETVSSQLGAFPLGRESLDAVLLVTVPPGRYSAMVTDASGQGGNALIEIYDATDLGGSGSDLANLSTRGLVGPGRALVGGFVVSGNTPKRVLVRGVGPSLGLFGVGDALPEVNLILTHRVDGTEVVIDENSGWSSRPNADGIAEATANAGAFALNAGSQDSAMLLWLEPGVYTAAVQSGSPGLSGAALIEVYQID